MKLLMFTVVANEMMKKEYKAKSPYELACEYRRDRYRRVRRVEAAVPLCRNGLSEFRGGRWLPRIVATKFIVQIPDRGRRHTHGRRRIRSILARTGAADK